jgi:hypothetical protein
MALELVFLDLYDIVNKSRKEHSLSSSDMKFEVVCEGDRLSPFSEKTEQILRERAKNLGIDLIFSQNLLKIDS